jgi:hypothetical protein
VSVVGGTREAEKIDRPSHRSRQAVGTQGLDAAWASLPAAMGRVPEASSRSSREKPLSLRCPCCCSSAAAGASAGVPRALAWDELRASPSALSRLLLLERERSRYRPQAPALRPPRNHASSGAPCASPAAASITVVGSNLLAVAARDDPAATGLCCEVAPRPLPCGRPPARTYRPEVVTSIGSLAGRVQHELSGHAHESSSHAAENARQTRRVVDPSCPRACIHGNLEGVIRGEGERVRPAAEPCLDPSYHLPGPPGRGVGETEYRVWIADAGRERGRLRRGDETGTERDAVAPIPRKRA